jgi:hypothetical protein
MFALWRRVRLGHMLGHMLEQRLWLWFRHRHRDTHRHRHRWAHGGSHVADGPGDEPAFAAEDVVVDHDASALLAQLRAVSQLVRSHGCPRDRADRATTFTAEQSAPGQGRSARRAIHFDDALLLERLLPL